MDKSHISKSVLIPTRLTKIKRLEEKFLRNEPYSSTGYPEYVHQGMTANQSLNDLLFNSVTLH